MDQSDSNNYQLACQRYFEFSHKSEEFVAVNHPNQYFESSMRLCGNSKGTQAANKSYIKREPIKIEMTQ